MIQPIAHARRVLPLALLGLAALPVLAADPPATGNAERDPVADRVAAIAADRATGPEASIPFPEHGGIRNWRVVDRDTILIEGTGGRWYRAELMTPCFDLPFATTIGFRSGPAGGFDRFSSVIVGDQRCQLKSLVETAPPPRRGSRAAERDAANAERRPSSAK